MPRDIVVEEWVDGILKTSKTEAVEDTPADVRRVAKERAKVKLNEAIATQQDVKTQIAALSEAVSVLLDTPEG